ncbi:MAG TPA: hypothetical protein VHG93_27295 [Longimicrobium sp.]|nr:hypothetical protein [Longimicrobium sp.]
MRINRIPLLLPGALLLACGRGGDADAPPAAPREKDSVQLVARVGCVTVEHVRVYDRRTGRSAKPG